MKSIFSDSFSALSETSSKQTQLVKVNETNATQHVKTSPTRDAMNYNKDPTNHSSKVKEEEKETSPMDVIGLPNPSSTSVRETA